MRIDIEPTKLYKNESSARMADLRGEFRGLPLQTSNLSKPTVRQRRRKLYNSASEKAETPKASTMMQPQRGNEFEEESDAARKAEGDVIIGCADEPDDGDFDHALRSEGLQGGIPQYISTSPTASDRTFRPAMHPSFAFTKALLMELRVKQRLLPSMILLSHPSMLKEDDVRDAGEQARIALRLATHVKVSEALQARCAYYVALAEFLLAGTEGRVVQPSSSSLKRESDDPTWTDYFKPACAAKGVYEEGAWAEEWVRYLAGMDSSPTTRRRPESWIGELWSLVLGSDKVSSADEAIGVAAWKSPAGLRMRSADAKDLEKTKDSDSEGVFGSTADLFNADDEPQREVVMLPEHALPPVPLSLESSDDQNKKQSFEGLSTLKLNMMEDSLNTDHTSFSPTTPAAKYAPPPNTPACIQSSLFPSSEQNRAPRSTSLAFSAETKDFESDPGSPGRSSIYHRDHGRRNSVFSLSFGHKRRRSELELMEEGDSPFKTTFDESEYKKTV